MWWIALLVALALVVYFWPKGLLLVLAFAAALIAFVVIQSYREDALRAQISFSTRYAPQACPAGRPLEVSITNNAERELERVLFTFSARLPGYSTEVTPYTYRQNVSEKIVPPGASHVACYPLPDLRAAATRMPAAAQAESGTSPHPLPAQLEWSAVAERAEFAK